MANLPSNRTKLQSAISNQVAGTTADASANINAMIESYDTIDLLNQKVDGLVSAGILSPIPPVSIYRQALNNSNFDIWQRGTSFSSGGYGPDRWVLALASGMSCITSQQSFTPGQPDVPNEPKYFARYALSGTPGGSFWISQRIEDVRSFAGNTITISFWVKASSNLNNVGISVNQVFGSGGSAEVPTTSTYNITTSWRKVSITLAIPNVSGKTIGTNSYLDIRILFSSNAAHISTIDFAQAQVNFGSVAYPYQPKSYADELRDCMRYFEPLDFNAIASLVRFSTNTAICKYLFKVQKRIVPALYGSSDLSTTFGTGSKQIQMLRYSDNALITATGNVSLVSDTSPYMTQNIGSVKITAVTSLSGSAGDNLYALQTVKDTICGFDAEL